MLKNVQKCFSSLSKVEYVTPLSDAQKLKAHIHEKNEEIFCAIKDNSTLIVYAYGPFCKV